MMNQDLSTGVKWEQAEKREHLQATLYEMFPISAHERGVDVELLTERYLNYKMEYVKHLAFNPEEQNFSKFFF